MRGDHHTKSFLFHYENLSPSSQAVSVQYQINDGMLKAWIGGKIAPGEKLDHSFVDMSYGDTMHFQVWVIDTYILEDFVVIPPPPN